MTVYILTQEPYHDNSSVLGVFTDLDKALETLKASVDPSNINCDDKALAEWDVTGNKEQRVWWMRGEQVTDPTKKGWYPVRKDFEFVEPEPC